MRESKQSAYKIYVNYVYNIGLSIIQIRNVNYGRIFKTKSPLVYARKRTFKTSDHYS